MVDYLGNEKINHSYPGFLNYNLGYTRESFEANANISTQAAWNSSNIFNNGISFFYLN